VLSQGKMEQAGLLLGMLECLRAHPGAAEAERPGALLDELLLHPCLAPMPWLGFRAQVQRACLRPEERQAALTEATAIATRFHRRSEDRRGEDVILSEVSEKLTAGVMPPRIDLEHL